MRMIPRMTVLTCVLLGAAAAARAEVNLCTNIASVPFTIGAPGIYCLNADLSYPSPSGAAISINSDDVVLDFNGHTVDNLAAGPGTGAYGVMALSRTNVTIRNGTVRGFYYGTLLSGRAAPQNNIVEDMRADRCTSVGLSVRGTGSVARHNLVTRTGGDPFQAVGLYGLGDGVHVVDNEVVGTIETPGASYTVGIRVDSGVGAVVERNVVSNGAKWTSDSVGIRFSGSSPQGSVVGNRVVNFRYGIYFDFGGSGIYMDNTVGGAGVPFFGGTAAGATNFTF